MQTITVLSLLLLGVWFVETAYVRPCYFTNWAQNRPGNGKYEPEMYVPGLCTHIMYAFGRLNSDFTVSASESSDLGAGGNFARVNALKQRQAGLKTLLSLGGYNAGTATFRQLASSAQNRRVFISSVLRFVDSHGFDGVDVDWEYPEAADRGNFVTLMYELKVAAGPRLVTAAVSANPDRIASGYDAVQLGRIVDFLNVMTYDFHGSWEQQTGIHSPLFAGAGDSPQWNSAYAMNFWASRGVPKNKLVLGIATYGRGWTLRDANNNGLKAPGSVMPAMPYTREQGIAAYYEICVLGGTERWDARQKAPYMVKERLWIGYDNVQSVQAKMQWVKENGFGGAFVWTLDFDDFRGTCGTRYPLIAEIARQLGGSVGPVPPPSAGVPSPPPPPPQPAPAQPPASPSRLGSFTCPSASGHFADPANCGKYYVCADGRVTSMSCPSGLRWNDSVKTCDWPANVRCPQ